ncbi:hypothetical protein DNR41_27165, partial [Escherichia coli]
IPPFFPPKKGEIPFPKTPGAVFFGGIFLNFSKKGIFGGKEQKKKKKVWRGGVGRGRKKFFFVRKKFFRLPFTKGVGFIGNPTLLSRPPPPEPVFAWDRQGGYLFPLILFPASKPATDTGGG